MIKEPEIKQQVINAPPDTYAVWKSDQIYWTARVWGFYCEMGRDGVNSLGEKIELDCYCEPLSGNFRDGHIDTSCNGQIEFVGTKVDCQYEIKKLKGDDKK